MPKDFCTNNYGPQKSSCLIKTGIMKMYGIGFLLRPLKMGKNFVFGCSLVFLFVCHAKSGTKNNERTGLNDISC